MHQLGGIVKMELKIAKSKPSKSNQMLLRDVKRTTEHLSANAKTKYWDSLLEKSSILNKDNWKDEISGWIERKDYFDLCDAVEHFCGCTLEIERVQQNLIKVYGIGYTNATVK